MPSSVGLKCCIQHGYQFPAIKQAEIQMMMQTRVMQNQIQSHYYAVFHRDKFWDQSFSLSISHLWAIYVENTMFSTMGMLMISSSI